MFSYNIEPNITLSKLFNSLIISKMIIIKFLTDFNTRRKILFRFTKNSFSIKLAVVLYIHNEKLNTSKQNM